MVKQIVQMYKNFHHYMSLAHIATEKSKDQYIIGTAYSDTCNDSGCKQDLYDGPMSPGHSTLFLLSKSFHTIH